MIIHESNFSIEKCPRHWLISLLTYFAIERNVWNNLNNLAFEQNEAAKSLAVWGKSEGEDLKDITEKLSELITKLSEAEGNLGN